MDKKAIGDAMDTLTHGVYILGVHTPEKDNLMTAAWLCQVSSSPAMLVVAVSASHLTAELIRKSKRFTVSVLSEKQINEALTCGRVSGRKSDKLQMVKTVYTESGLPVVEEACAQMECKVLDINEATNHVLFIAEVERATRNADDVLLYQRSTFF